MAIIGWSFLFEEILCKINRNELFSLTTGHENWPWRNKAIYPIWKKHWFVRFFIDHSTFPGFKQLTAELHCGLNCRGECVHGCPFTSRDVLPSFFLCIVQSNWYSNYIVTQQAWNGCIASLYAWQIDNLIQLSHSHFKSWIGGQRRVCWNW